MKRGLATTILVCLTTMVSHSFGRSTLGLLLPAIEDDLGLTYTEAGRPGTALYLAYIVGVVLVALVAGRIEPITIMRVGLAAAAVGLALSATADGIGALTVGVALAGGSGAGIWLTAPLLATAHVSPERRGVVIALLSSSIGLSNIVLGFGTTAMRQRLDDDLAWRPVWAAEAVFTVGLLLALIVVARFALTERVTGGLGFAPLLAIPQWKRVTVAYACFGAMSAGVLAFALIAMEQQGGLSRTEATTMFSVMGIVGMLATPVLGGLSDRYGRRPFLVLSLLTLTAANLLVALGGRWPLIMAMVIVGIMAGTFPALIATYVRDHADNRAFSQAMAAMTVLFSLFAAAAPSITGWLADTTGTFRLSFLFLAALPAVGMVLLAGLRPAPVSATASRPVVAPTEHESQVKRR